VPHQSPAPGFRYAPGLDGVRALAVLAVVAYHLGTTSDDVQLLRGGYLGVDVFFVLSGYLITSLLVVEVHRTGRISIKEFYARRARRLLPALFALLFTVAVIGIVWLPQQAAKIRGDLLAALGYSTNWWLIVENSSYFDGGDRPRLLTHLWSLAVEEQFYLIWPLVLILFARRLVRRRTILAVLVVAVTASSVAAALLYNPWADPSRVYYGTDTRALAPLLGAALAIWVRPWKHRNRIGAARRTALDMIGLAGLAGLGVIAALLADTDPRLYRGGMTVIAVLAAALVGVAGHPGSGLGRLLGRQPLRWIGQRSYAIYLWHWPVCVLTRPAVDVPVTGWANVALRVGASLVLAELSYWLVERPLRRPGFFLRPRSLHRIRPPAFRLPNLRGVLLTVAVAVAAGAVGFQLQATAALPVDDVPVDAGPETTLGPLDPSGDPSGAPVPGPSTGPTPGGPRLVIFGDSQGMTLLRNKPADLGRYFAASDATIEGCGVLVGRVASRSGERRDLTPACSGWTARWSASAKRLAPQIALVMIGAWEVFDLTTPTTGTLTFGSPQWDSHVSNAIRQGVTALRASGAQVALSLLPCYRPVKASAGFWPERGDDDRTRHVNTLLRAAAAADPTRVHVIEPPVQFCTDPKISTSRSYRWDGVHYYKPGAALYFKATVPQLLKLLPSKKA
jgi:peptidoglycan/LPS O-acetylase OafA/YrhL